jgi:hypothetical protein
MRASPQAYCHATLTAAGDRGRHRSLPPGRAHRSGGWTRGRTSHRSSSCRSVQPAPPLLLRKIHPTPKARQPTNRDRHTPERGPEPSDEPTTSSLRNDQGALKDHDSVRHPNRPNDPDHAGNRPPGSVLSAEDLRVLPPTPWLRRGRSPAPVSGNVTRAMLVPCARSVDNDESPAAWGPAFASVIRPS